MRDGGRGGTNTDADAEVFCWRKEEESLKAPRADFIKTFIKNKRGNRRTCWLIRGTVT